MRILVLHSAVAPDARPDELDTLVTAEAVAAALMQAGHIAEQAPFVPDPDALKARTAGVDLVFNLVESVHGRDELAAIAPAMLEALGIAYTGCNAAANALTSDKPATKRILRAAGLATPAWGEPPHWTGLDPHARYIVKAATADASIGLDEGCVVAAGRVSARAEDCARRFGGRWFAEAYIEGREFNVSVLDGEGGPTVLPLAEMRFTDWDAGKPTIVDYAAKWDANDAAGAKMIRSFGTAEPALAVTLRDMALKAFDLVSLAGYARVDFRVDEQGRPLILEINANPCLAPDAGFAAAAAEAGLSYPDLVAHIAGSVRHV